MEFGRTTTNVPLGPFLGGMVPPMTTPSMFPQVQGIWAFGVQEEGVFGQLCLDRLGLGQRGHPGCVGDWKEGEGARGVARALWWAAPAFVAARPGVVLGGAFIPTRPPIGAPVLKLRAYVADA